MPLTRLVLHNKAFRDILRSERVRSDMTRRANNIADTAGDGYRVDSEIGRTRARAAVITASYAARFNEATNRTLTRALDAGRH